MSLPINQIICGDALEVMADWPDGCVDLVLTDPPYPKEFDSVWDSLASSYRVLRNGGFCVTLLGHYQLPRVLDAMRRGGYEFFWIATADNNNQPIMHGFKAKCCFKPCLIFRKGRGLPNRIFYDKFSLRMKTKDWQVSQDLHKWGQSKELFYEPMDSMSSAGDIVLDPFVGSGTVCEVAKMLGRNYIGIDIDEGYCETARMRIKAVETGVPVKEQKKGQMGLFERTKE